MKSTLVDSTVFIYALRKDPTALEYLENEFGNFYISFVSVGEILQGCKSDFHFKSANNLISNTPIHWGSQHINKSACELLKKHSKNGLMLLDALIAATAIEEHLTVVSHNIKHFKNIDGLVVRGIE